MEAITNLASTATNAASKLIYGDTATTTTKTNETAGKEPISGEQGKGTATDPYDQGNAATPLEKPSDSSNTFLDYSNNETGGKEPISGVLGKGTATEPFDQGNSVNPTNSSSSTSRPLDSSTDANTSDFDSKSPGGTQATGITDKAGVTDKIWKPTTVDDINTSVISDAPVDPLTREKADSDHPFEKSDYTSTGNPSHTTSSIPAPVETTSFPSTERSSHTFSEPSSSTPIGHPNVSSTDNSKIPIPVEKPSAPSDKSGLPSVDAAPIEYRYEGSGPPNNNSDSHKTSAAKEFNTGFEKAIHTPTEQHHDIKTDTSTGLATEGVHSDASKTAVSGEANRLAGENSGSRFESTTSPTSTSPTVGNSGATHESKMSHIKDKLKDKLHIGHK